jgi:hypothetical protein
MIDRTKEKLITFAQLARLNPGRVKGKTMDPSAIWRMAHEGSEGVRLEYIIIGSTAFTSVEALERYSAAVRRAKEDARRAKLSGRTPAKRQREAAKAKKALAAKTGGSRRRPAVAQG